MCPELANPLSRRSKRSQEQRVPKRLLSLPSPSPAAAGQSSGTKSLFPGAAGHQTSWDGYTGQGLTLATGQREIVSSPLKIRGWIPRLLWTNFLGPHVFKKGKRNKLRVKRRRVRQSKLVHFPFTLTHFQQICILQVNHMADITFNVVLFISIKTVYLFAFHSTFQQTVRNKTKLYGSSSSISWYFLLLGVFLLVTH